MNETETTDLERRHIALARTQEKLKEARDNLEHLSTIDDVTAEEREQAVKEVEHLEQRFKRQREKIQRIEVEQRAEAEREKEARIHEVFDEGVARSRKAALPLCRQLEHGTDQVGQHLARVLGFYREANAKVAEFVGPMAIQQFTLDEGELLRALIGRICRATRIDPVLLTSFEAHGWASAINAPLISKTVEASFDLLEGRRPTDDPKPVATIVEADEKFTGPIEPI